MSVSRINGLNSNSPKVIPFKSKSDEYENPISRRTERNLAILGSVGGAGVLGLLAGGLTGTFAETKPWTDKTISGLFKAKKNPILVGLAAAALMLIVTLPAKIYNTKVNAFVKDKEMDVFSRDRELKSNLTEEVGAEVKDPKVDLDKKLDDNLKLQMANRGGAIGITNISPQS